MLLTSIQQRVKCHRHLRETQGSKLNEGGPTYSLMSLSKNMYMVIKSADLLN